MSYLKFKTIFINFSKSPLVLLHKIYKRLFDNRTSMSNTDLYVWLENNQSDLETFCKDINEELWLESILDMEEIEANIAVQIELIKHPVVVTLPLPTGSGSF